MGRIARWARSWLLVLCCGACGGSTTVDELVEDSGSDAADESCPSETVAGDPCAVDGMICPAPGDLPCGGSGGEYWEASCVDGTWRAEYYSEGCDDFDMETP